MDKEKVASRPNGVAYWRGTVDTRLKNLEDKVDAEAIKTDKILEKMERIETAVGAEKGRSVTWDFIREKITVPLLVATIIIVVDLLLH